MRGADAGLDVGGSTPEEARSLIAEALAVKNKGSGYCPACAKMVQVEILDARAVSRRCRRCSSLRRAG